MAKFHFQNQIVYEGKALNGLEVIAKSGIEGKIVGLKNATENFDLQTELPDGEDDFYFFDNLSKECLALIRHTSAHIMAEAVQNLFPETKVTIGPVIQDGFYYDFERETAFSVDDFPAIEKEMKKIIKARKKLKREIWTVEKALEFFRERKESYKVELIEDLVRDQAISEVSVYWQDDFVDLCKGPHVSSTGFVSAFKLLSVAGAYWRGNENNKMLSRIYGTAFLNKSDLKEHLEMIEEAKKRDHRKIGTEQSLFSMHEASPASPFFHPRGAYIYKQLQSFLEELNHKNNYEDVITPLLLDDDLWHQSGHYENYKENMYFTGDDEGKSFAIKPMNCPGHCLIFSKQRHSYRELPIRYCEFGRVHRKERSGAVAGLFRVRSFVQDDAHVFCTEEQVQGEILNILKMVKEFYSAFGFQYSIELSTRPEKYIGELSTWDKAENALKGALEAAGEDYELNPGDGAFYGPKIDFHLRDSIGRSHQCGTVQLDFSMPSRFNLNYTAPDNKMYHPVMIHRAIAGSLERFLGILIEHYAGRFPLWMLPQQAIILNIGDDTVDCARKAFDHLKNKGYRLNIDDGPDKLSAKIKRAQDSKYPLMIIIGKKEAQENTFSLRMQDATQKSALSMDEIEEAFNAEQRPQIS